MHTVSYQTFGNAGSAVCDGAGCLYAVIQQKAACHFRT